MEHLADLNEAQKEAVTNTTGPVMIIAGPGSGKTRVLTYRIAHLMYQGVDPFKILALTFTNKAAREMKARIEVVRGAETRNLWMGTFHSIFARILRVEGRKLGYPSNFTIYDTDDSKSLIKAIVKEEVLNDKLYKPNTVFYRISSAKNELISPKAYLENDIIMSEDASAGRPKLGRLYLQYAKRCFRAGAMDFDDLLYKMHELISRFPEVLEKYQNYFSHIMIDEFQDTNYAQYEIVKKLAWKHKNIGVVGDDAQSIYSFRGATLDNIHHFQKDFPSLRTYKLEQNYRSTQNIVDAANAIIANNRSQLDKTIWTKNDHGLPINIIQAASDNEEGKKVAEALFEYKMRNQLRHNDFAILYRTNAQSRSFEEAFRRINIPYRIYGGLSFYQRKEIKDLLAYLKLIINPADEGALRRIINYPARGIGKTTLEKLTVFANDNEQPLWNMITENNLLPLSGRVRKALDEFQNMIRSFQAMLEEKNAYEVAAHVARSTKILAELYNDKSVEGLSRYENLQELLNSIKEFTEQAESQYINPEIGLDRGLGSYLQQVMLLTDQDQQDKQEDTVKMMTIHAAKGLEFKCVFAVGLEENLFPSHLSLNSREDLEEERRLFYVAVTRAERSLFISHSATRYRYGSLIYCKPSRFLDEIPPELVKVTGDSAVKHRPAVVQRQVSGVARPGKTTQPTYKHKVVGTFVPADPKNLQTGMEVEHQKFGMGKIVSMDGQGLNKMATVFFQKTGQKKLLLKFAKLQIVGN